MTCCCSKLVYGCRQIQKPSHCYCTPAFFSTIPVWWSWSFFRFWPSLNCVLAIFHTFPQFFNHSLLIFLWSSDINLDLCFVAVSQRIFFRWSIEFLNSSVVDYFCHTFSLSYALNLSTHFVVALILWSVRISFWLAGFCLFSLNSVEFQPCFQIMAMIFSTHLYRALYYSFFVSNC